MFKERQGLYLPKNEKQIIWRYVDFPNLIHMFHSNSLWFSNVVECEDPYEGSIGSLGKKYWNKYLTDLIDRNIIDKQQQDKLLDAFEISRKYIFINCWHISNHESIAMWNIYSGVKNGLVIKSTIKRLKKSFLNANEEINIGKIKYIDYSKYDMKERDPVKLAFYKRKQYSYEKEVRASIFDPFHLDINKEIPKGHLMQINMKNLISSIYLHPNSKEWFYNTVSSACRKFGYKGKIEYSSIDKIPVY